MDKVNEVVVAQQDIPVRIDKELEQFYAPEFDATLLEVVREVAEMRDAGTLRPFVEGEPVGALPRRVRQRRLTDAQVKRARDRRMEDARTEMLALRRRNNADMRRLLS